MFPELSLVSAGGAEAGPSTDAEDGRHNPSGAHELWEPSVKPAAGMEADPRAPCGC